MEYLIIIIFIIIIAIFVIKDLEGEYTIKSNEIISQEEYKHNTFKVLRIVHKITYKSGKIEYKQKEIYC